MATKYPWIKQQLMPSGLALSVFFWIVFGIVTIFMASVVIGMLIYWNGQNLEQVWQDAEFRFALVFTLKSTFLATALATFLSVPSGYLLSRASFPGKVFIDTLFDLPLILPPLVSGVALLILFGPLLGNHMAQMGLDIVFTPAGVVVAQCYIAIPFAMKIFKQSFDAIDPRLEKIARTLGYSPYQVFCRVTLPLARKGMLGGITMTWARTLGEFGAVAMLAGVTRMKTETLAAAIFLNMTLGDLQFALAVAILLLVTAMAILTFFKILTKSEVKI